MIISNEEAKDIAEKKWRESPAKAVEFIYNEYSDLFMQATLKQGWVFYDEATHYLKEAMNSSIHKIDDGIIHTDDIERIKAIDQRLQFIFNHPEYVLYDISQGNENLRPIQHDEFMITLDEIIGAWEAGKISMPDQYND